MAYRTIQERIDAARGRIDRTGDPRPERTLSITFSSSQIRTLIKRFGLNERRDGLPTIVQKIGNEFGVTTTKGEFDLTIAERIGRSNSVSLSFLIDSVYTFCETCGINPATQGVDELANAIVSNVVKDTGTVAFQSRVVRVTSANEYVEQALKSGRAILHTMGEHAGEPPKVFIARKKADIADLGFTFWYARSVQPPNARHFCDGADPTFVLFYQRLPENRRKRNGKILHAGEPTNTSSKKFGYMTHYCDGNRDGDVFRAIPGVMRQPGRYVTGLVDKGACGFVFDDLREVEPERGFNPSEWNSVFKKSSQAGAWCAVRAMPKEHKTWYIVAVARVCKPYGVWFQGECGVPPIP